MHNEHANNAAAVRVAFQGELGAYSDEAVRQFFGGAAEPVACRYFEAVGERTTAGDVDYGLLPIRELAGRERSPPDLVTMRMPRQRTRRGIRRMELRTLTAEDRCR